MIKTERLTKHYGTIHALSEVDLEVAPGEILGFLGPNGAGKSTTLRILSGYLPPTSGKASINGLDLMNESLAARRCTGYLPENFVAPSELRVSEYLRFRAALKGLSRKQVPAEVQRVAKHLGLEPRLRQPFSALSKGFRQRVGLADALLGDPPALLLDEPFSGLDPLQREEFRTILKNLAAAGKAILFSSHVLPEVEEIATRVLILHQGRSKAVGTLEDLQSHLHEKAKLCVRLSEAGTKAHEVLAAAAQELDFSFEEQNDKSFLIELNDHSHRSDLFQRLAAAKLPVIEFRELRPDLDQLFRSLVEETAT
ncbi:MAG: ABC transporter ATP-binding protein [Planctomycetes bacterium]|nr:ABC transporter ATP-binding protein [Planctomycetota bacterium]MCP4772437.1 ABC transporter ATP-binding protein [Planctomycetota bacterium]MCP4860170.1 ABC transporter ATP-binding protein [Planctomycetota bacterium]